MLAPTISHRLRVRLFCHAPVVKVVRTSLREEVSDAEHREDLPTVGDLCPRLPRARDRVEPGGEIPPVRPLPPGCDLDPDPRAHVVALASASAIPRGRRPPVIATTCSSRWCGMSTGATAPPLADQATVRSESPAQPLDASRLSLLIWPVPAGDSEALRPRVRGRSRLPLRRPGGRQLATSASIDGGRRAPPESSSDPPANTARFPWLRE
jgi:hypothetical protein